MRSRIGVVLFALAALVLTGCTDRGAREQSSASDSIVVVDHAQRAVRLDSAARRVISFMPAVTDLLLALGAQERLIARTDFDLDPRIANLPSTGNALTPSLEWVASLRPDLVIAWPDQPSRSVVARLSSLGIPVYAAVTESVSDVLRTARDLGALLHVELQADSIIRSIQSELAAVRTAVSTYPRVRVVYVLSVDPPMVAGPATFIGELIDVAGGENVFADVGGLWPQVSLEELLKRNPTAIVVARESGDSSSLRLRERVGWSQLDAVKTGRVLTVDVNLFNRPGPTLPRAARELARFLHPETRL